MPATVVGGVDYWLAQLIVLGTPRPEGLPLILTTVSGVPIVVLDPVILAPFVPATLTGEAAGLSQVFLSPVTEGLASVAGGPVSPFSTRQFAEMMDLATASALAAQESSTAATTAAAQATTAAASLANASAGAVLTTTGQRVPIVALYEGESFANLPRPSIFVQLER